MGGGGSRIPPPPPIPRVKVFNSLKPNTSAPASVESVVLSRKDPRQQWQIVLQPDKKFMKLKNVANGKYLYLGLEPLTGENQFSTIDLDKTIDGKKANYKYSPVFSKVSENDIDNATTFNFISSFGPQMDIIDKSTKVIDKSTAKLSSKKGNRLTLTSLKGSPICIFGIFMFAKDGTIINKDTSKTYSSSVNAITVYSTMYFWGRNFYYNYNQVSNYSTNALKIVNQNSSRNYQEVFSGQPVNIGNPNWNTSALSPNNNGTDMSYCSMTKLDGTGVGGGDIWEYDNVDPVDFSVIEIYGDKINYAMNGLLLELYNDNVNNSKPVWSRKIKESDILNKNTNTFITPLILKIE